MVRKQSFWKRLPKEVVIIGCLVTSYCHRARSVLKGILRWSVSDDRAWLRNAHQPETSSETLHLVKYSITENSENKTERCIGMPSSPILYTTAWLAVSVIFDQHLPFP